MIPLFVIKIPDWPLVWRADNFKFNITIKMIVWRSSYSILEYNRAPIWHQEIIYIPLSRWRAGALALLNENSFLCINDRVHVTQVWSLRMRSTLLPIVQIPPRTISSDQQPLNLNHEYLTPDMIWCRVTSLQYWTSLKSHLCIINAQCPLLPGISWCSLQQLT